MSCSEEVGLEPLEERSVVHGRALRALMEHQDVGLVEGGAGEVRGPIEGRQRVKLEEEQPLSRRGDHGASLKGHRRPRRLGHFVEQARWCAAASRRERPGKWRARSSCPVPRRPKCSLPRSSGETIKSMMSCVLRPST